MMERTGEPGEPYGAPTVNSNGSDVLSLKCSLTVRYLRKEQHQLTSSCAKPRLLRICTSLLWLMLLKKPCMSNKRRPQHSPTC
jgi:hypothetical protein